MNIDAAIEEHKKKMLKESEENTVSKNEKPQDVSMIEKPSTSELSSMPDVVTEFQITKPVVNWHKQLWTAAKNNDAAAFDEALAHNANVMYSEDTDDYTGCTVLHCAAFSGSFAMVWALLDRGANPLAEMCPTRFGGASARIYTPIQMAEMGHHREVASFLKQAAGLEEKAPSRVVVEPKKITSHALLESEDMARNFKREVLGYGRV